LEGEMCPYSSIVPGQKVLRGCLLHEVEGTSPRGAWSYLTQCPPKGYANNFGECPEYLKAEENDIDPDELIRRRERRRGSHEKALA